jgi:hypothetical protein
MMNSRDLSWNIAAGVGFSFVLTVIMAITAVAVKLFYPPSIISISPIISLFITPALGIIQLIVLALSVAFVTPIRSNLIVKELGGTRKLGFYTGAGYLIFSILLYAFHVPYIQTYVGLIIAFNIINGAIGGFASSVS